MTTIVVLPRLLTYDTYQIPID